MLKLQVFNDFNKLNCIYPLRYMPLINKINYGIAKNFEFIYSRAKLFPANLAALFLLNVFHLKRLRKYYYGRKYLFNYWSTLRENKSLGYIIFNKHILKDLIKNIYIKGKQQIIYLMCGFAERLLKLNKLN